MEEAEQLRPEYPMANITGRWCLKNKDGNAVVEGAGAYDLVASLLKFEKDITKIYGFEIRTRLKGATIECITKSAKAQIVPPLWVWYFSGVDGEYTKAFDPIDMLLAGHKEKIPFGQLMVDIGMTLTSEEQIRRLAPDLQVNFVRTIVQKLGLDRSN